MGGMGPSRTPELAARFANEFNVPFASATDSAAQFDRVRAAMSKHGRSEMVFSNALVVCVGKNDAEVARRAAAIGRDVDELKTNGVAGSPAEAVDKLGRYAEAGATRVYLQVLDLDDLDHLELVAAEVAPLV
jgi:alkanesulfonate monooxygenase SsuD/methylene tetrahydromethanopterin reductase-like flavin-dependent oxidoreductase (luciferase family)